MCQKWVYLGMAQRMPTAARPVPVEMMPQKKQRMRIITPGPPTVA